MASRMPVVSEQAVHQRVREDSHSGVPLRVHLVEQPVASDQRDTPNDDEPDRSTHGELDERSAPTRRDRQGRGDQHRDQDQKEDQEPLGGIERLLQAPSGPGCRRRGSGRSCPAGRSRAPARAWRSGCSGRRPVRTSGGSRRGRRDRSETFSIEASARFTSGTRLRRTFPSASDTVSLSPRMIASTCVCTKRLASTQNVSKASLSNDLQDLFLHEPVERVGQRSREQGRPLADRRERVRDHLLDVEGREHLVRQPGCDRLLNRGVVRERRHRRHVPIGVQDGSGTPHRRHADREHDHGEDDQDRRQDPPHAMTLRCLQGLDTRFQFLPLRFQPFDLGLELFG